MDATRILKGRFSVTRPHGDNCDYIAVSLTDRDSGIEFAEARVKYAEFAKSLGGLEVECDLVLRGLDLVGLRREHKTELVFIPECAYEDRKENAQQAIAPFEVDGWKGNVRDALNRHRVVEVAWGDNNSGSRVFPFRGATHKVSFVRWVDKGKENES